MVKYSLEDKVNLNILYTYQYVQNQEVANIKSGIDCVYPFENTPILKDTTIGTIYYNDIVLYTFFDKSGDLILTKITNSEEYPVIVASFIDYKTNKIHIKWDRTIPVGRSYLVISYEYSLECESPRQIECPHCKNKFFEKNYNSVTDNVINFNLLQQLAGGNEFLKMY